MEESACGLHGDVLSGAWLNQRCAACFSARLFMHPLMLQRLQRNDQYLPLRGQPLTPSRGGKATV
jgi:hypothetical protein